MNEMRPKDDGSSRMFMLAEYRPTDVYSCENVISRTAWTV